MQEVPPITSTLPLVSNVDEGINRPVPSEPVWVHLLACACCAWTRRVLAGRDIRRAATNSETKPSHARTGKLNKELE